MLKSRRSIVTIIVAVLAILALVVVILVNKFGIKPKKIPLAEILPQNVKTAAVDSDLALHQSDIENIFYTMDTAGKVAFYEYKNSKVEKIQPTATKKITLDLSAQKVPVTLSYVQRENQITGYGLFVNDEAHRGDEQISFFDYVFFKVVPLPPSHQNAETKNVEFLILGDENKDDFFKANQTYEYSYYYNFETDKATRFFDETTNIADITGKKRSDYAVLTDDILHSTMTAGKDFVPFFTSRNYNAPKDENDPKPLVDLYIKQKGQISRYTYKIDYLYTAQTTKGLVFLRKTEKGFNSILFQDMKETVIHSFTGNYETDYARYKNYVYHHETGVVTNLWTGENITLPATNITSVTNFAVAENGKRIALGGEPTGRRGIAMLALYDLEREETRTMVQAGLFTTAFADFTFIGNDTFFRNTPSVNTDYAGTFIDWENIFTAEIVKQTVANTSDLSTHEARTNA